MYKTLSRAAIKVSFNFSVWFISRFYDMTPYIKKAEELAAMPNGTLGNDIAKCLNENNLRLVPKFESHDLKHVLLNFKMTPVDEIRMQAFMLGNGNYSPACFAILFFGILLLPTKLPVFYKDFFRGRKISPISSWTIDEYAMQQTVELRKSVMQRAPNGSQSVILPALVKYCAFASIISGIIGMLFCLPYLFSSLISDLVGAGFPFLAGSILTIGGLLTLSNLAKQQPEHAAIKLDY